MSEYRKCTCKHVASLHEYGIGHCTAHDCACLGLVDLREAYSPVAAATPEGVKHDEDKADLTPMLDRLFSQAGLMPAWRGVTAVLAYGALKYPAFDNWLKVEPKERYLKATLRHLSAHTSGDVMDPESGLPHIHHALTSLAFYVARL